MALAPKFAAQRLGSAGSGTHTIELYLDYVCPFSMKMFHTVATQVIPEVNQTHPNKVQFVFVHQVQPWHPSSTLVHEAAIAVSQLAPNKFWEFSSALFQKSEEYYDSSLWGESRKETYERLAELAYDSASIDKKTFLEYLAIDPQAPAGQKNGGNRATNDLKLWIKYSRQNGVHVSPTVTIDGIIDNSFDSSLPAEKWLEKIKAL